MPQKEVRCLITFPSTTAAMQWEDFCRKKLLPGRLIPLPGFVSAGCGMAWSAPPDQKEALLDAALQAALSYENCLLITL